MNLKKCKACEQIKPIDQFYRDIKNVTGYRNICKKCQDEPSSRPQTAWSEIRRLKQILKAMTPEQGIQYLEQLIGRLGACVSLTPMTEEILQYAQERLNLMRMEYLIKPEQHRKRLKRFNKPENLS